MGRSRPAVFTIDFDEGAWRELLGCPPDTQSELLMALFRVASDAAGSPGPGAGTIERGVASLRYELDVKRSRLVVTAAHGCSMTGT